jgi:hypothetical protein
MEDGEVYVLSSDWDSGASLESYIKSVSGGALLGAIRTLGLSTRIRMGGAADWEGVEALQRIRRKTRMKKPSI